MPFKVTPLVAFNILLVALILAVGAKLLFDLTVPPDNIYSIAPRIE